MHSSRMRTGRSLTVCRGGFSLPEGGLPAGGFSLLVGSPCQGGFSLPGGVLLAGGGSPYWGVSLRGGFSLLETHPVDRITNTSKNITLATTSLRPVNIVRIARIA